MKEYEIHPAAGLVPMAVEAEQLVLKMDIEENGQRDPAALYRGKIVDGRCRYKACNELGIELKVIPLPNNMSIADVEAYVKSVNTRRNLTRSQKVITAYREMLKTKLSGAKTAERWALTPTEISSAKFISVNRPDYAEKIFNGGNVKIGFDEKKNKPVYSSSISKVRKAVAEEIGEASMTPEGDGGSKSRQTEAQLLEIVANLTAEIIELKNILKDTTTEEKVAVEDTTTPGIDTNAPFGEEAIAGDDNA